MSDQVVVCPICGLTLHNCNHSIEEIVEVQNRQIVLWEMKCDNLRRQVDALRDGIKDIPININSGMSALFSLEIMYVNDAKFYLNRAMKFAKDAIAAADEIAKEMED